MTVIHPSKALEELKEQYSLWADYATERQFTSSATLHFSVGRVYIRKMARPGLLCIANVDIDKEHQQKGIFSLFVSWLLTTEKRFDTLQVECIHNPHLERYLRRNGWTDAANSEPMAPTLNHKMIGEEQR